MDCIWMMYKFMHGVYRASLLCSQPPSIHRTSTAESDRPLIFLKGIRTKQCRLIPQVVWYIHPFLWASKFPPIRGWSSKIERAGSSQGVCPYISGSAVALPMLVSRARLFFAGGGEIVWWRSPGFRGSTSGSWHATWLASVITRSRDPYTKL